MSARLSRILTTCLTLAPTLALASAPAFTGWVTGSYDKNFNNPLSRKTSSLNYYQQGREATFQLDAAHLTIAGGDSGKAAYGIDLDAGANSAFNGGALVSANGWGVEIQQGFVSIPLGTIPLGLKAGKFYTTEGIEVLNSAVNPTISRGLLFGQLEPVSHTGAVLTGTPTDKIDFAIGAVNGWDNWTTTVTSGIPMAVAKVGFNFGNPFAGALTGYFGPNNWSATGRDNLASVDFTGVNKSLSLVDINVQVNFLYKENGYSDSTLTANQTNIGGGIQPLFHLPMNMQLGARYEFWNQSAKGGPALFVQSISLAPGWKPSASTLLRVEGRYDIADQAYFEDDKGVKSMKYEPTLAAELNYTF